MRSGRRGTANEKTWVNRQLRLTGTYEWRIRHGRYEFCRDAAAAQTPETTRVVTTIETCWPAIHVALTMDVANTNARTKAFNRITMNTSVSHAAFATSTTTRGGYSQPSC